MDPNEFNDPNGQNDEDMEGENGFEEGQGGDPDNLSDNSVDPSMNIP